MAEGEDDTGATRSGATQSRATTAPSGSKEPDEVAERITAALAAGDHDTATTVMLRGYGPELLRFLGAIHPSAAEADEVFSMVAEGLWVACATFRGSCSPRTWCYAIARRTSLRYRRDKARHRARFVAFADAPALAEVEAAVRTETASFLRTERRSKLVALREALPEDDQILLTLRIDRRLGFDEISLVMHEGDALELPDEWRKREAARLRKRFQTVKDRLREAGRRAGLTRSPKEP